MFAIRKDPIADLTSFVIDPPFHHLIYEEGWGSDPLWLNNITIIIHFYFVSLGNYFICVQKCSPFIQLFTWISYGWTPLWGRPISFSSCLLALPP
jgi:hypothetical protein